MKKLSRQNKKHLLSRSRYELKKKKRANRHYSYSSYRSSEQTPVEDFKPQEIQFKNLIAPVKFKLQHEYSDDVLTYINNVKIAATQGKNLNIMLDFIDEIGEGAIAMLLSTLEEFSKKGVIIKGSKPQAKLCRDILEKSGFFKYMNGKIADHNKFTKNTILTTGNSSTHQSIVALEIRKAMETIWEENSRNPLVYGTVFEMMRNSCDHAFRNENSVKWHLAISHDDENKQVKFSFVDNGKGIIRTFSEGLLKNVLGLFRDDVDLLETAFKDGIKSRTGLSWRGKGLPTIYENYNENYIRNLLVISNNVFIDFDRKIKTKLKSPFHGTYYYWIIDKKCVKACYN